MAKGKKLSYVSALAVAIALPLFFYILAKILGKDKIELPRTYFPTSVVDGDTVYKQLPEIHLVNQNGDTVGLNEDLKGKILLVNLFFTECTTICPQLSSNIQMMQHAYRKHAKMNSDMDTILHFVSISTDPNDSVEALRNYASEFKVDNNRWWLLTGDRSEIYNYARKELKISLKEENSGAEERDHSQTIVLIDRERNIRGYYDGLDSLDLRRCADDIGWLGLEKKRKK